MADYSASNKRVAKNTAFLYFRMLFLTLISLYTVRVTLEALGVVDYGIYAVIGSVVASLGFLTGTLTSATQRFLSFHLGKNDYEAYSRTFSLLLIGFLFISAIIVILGEVAGIFIVDDWLNIPPDRKYAANWVYQATIFTFIFHLLTVPYSSSIVANEKMNAFAYISIADGLMKLGIVYLLLLSQSDRLILYGFLALAQSVVSFALYVIYCHRTFRYCRFRWLWDKALFKELTSYTGWNLFGSVSWMLMTQGQNILLNIFFGPVVNTAKGISDRINSVVTQFSSNFYMAVNPQIVKSYAAGDIAHMFSLALKSSRFSYFLMLVIALPLCVCMKPLLDLWLGAGYVSVDMIAFCQLTIIFCLVASLEMPISQMIRATGSIGNYQLKVGILTLLYLPLAWVIFKLGASAVFSMVVMIVVYAVVQFVRVWIAHNQIGLSIGAYVREVVLPICIVSVIGVAGYFIFSLFSLSNVWIDILVKGFASLAFQIIVVVALGMSKSDRKFALGLIRRRK